MKKYLFRYLKTGLELWAPLQLVDLVVVLSWITCWLLCETCSSSSAKQRFFRTAPWQKLRQEPGEWWGKKLKVRKEEGPLPCLSYSNWQCICILLLVLWWSEELRNLSSSPKRCPSGHCLILIVNCCERLNRNVPFTIRYHLPSCLPPHRRDILN